VPGRTRLTITKQKPLKQKTISLWDKKRWLRLRHMARRRYRTITKKEILLGCSLQMCEPDLSERAHETPERLPEASMKKSVLSASWILMGNYIKYMSHDNTWYTTEFYINLNDMCLCATLCVQTNNNMFVGIVAFQKNKTQIHLQLQTP
jgi:hypothetical protein